MDFEIDDILAWVLLLVFFGCSFVTFRLLSALCYR